MGTEEIDSGKPLFVVCSRRVYRPSEAPEKAREKACESEHVHLEPEWLTDRLCESFAEEFESHGVTLHRGDRGRGPYWGLDSQGAGIAANLTCEDFRKFARKRKVPLRGLKALQDSGDLSLSTVAHDRLGSFYTRPESEFTGDEKQRPIADLLSEAWSDYVRDVTQRMFRDLESDRDYLCSWESVKDSLESNGQGIDDNGNRVDLNECRTEGSGYNVGDV